MTALLFRSVGTAFAIVLAHCCTPALATQNVLAPNCPANAGKKCVLNIVIDDVGTRKAHVDLDPAVLPPSGDVHIYWKLPRKYFFSEDGVEIKEPSDGQFDDMCPADDDTYAGCKSSGGRGPRVYHWHAKNSLDALPYGYTVTFYRDLDDIPFIVDPTIVNRGQGRLLKAPPRRR